MKKSPTSMRKLLLSLGALAMTGLFFGCESADSHEISVSPQTSTITAQNPSVRLTASGWDSSYSWTLSNSALGTLSATKGDSVIYTGKTFASNSTQVITVYAIGSGSGSSNNSSSTNSTSSATSSGYSTEATIYQNP